MSIKVFTLLEKFCEKVENQKPSCGCSNLKNGDSGKFANIVSFYEQAYLIFLFISWGKQVF